MTKMCNIFQLIVVNIFIKILFINVKIVDGQPSNYTNPSVLYMENSTSCEEFLANTTFDRNKLIDVDWKIFYFWNFDKEKTYHLKFRVPTRFMTDRYRVELDKELNPPVNWTDAVLFMETSIDFSGLFIRTELSGKFRLIPSLAFQAKSLPYLIFGLKFVEPGYLGIMNCKYRLCYALAPVDRMPSPEDLKLAADKIGFYSENGRSYLVQAESRPSPRPFNRDDADDDEDLDIEEHGFQANYIEDDSNEKYGDDEE